MILQLIVILLIFGIAVRSAMKKDKLKKLKEISESLEKEDQLEEWFDEATSDSYAEEESNERERPLRQAQSFTKKGDMRLKEGVSVTKGKHIAVEEAEIEVEPIVDLSSQEEIRKGIIWSEILQRKYI